MHGTKKKKHSKISERMDTSTNKYIASKIAWKRKPMFSGGQHCLQFRPLERGENECAGNPFFRNFINSNLFTLL